jgi:transcription elongation factor SPT5
MRRDSNRAIATDSEGHELRINDNVKETDGEVCLSLRDYPML